MTNSVCNSGQDSTRPPGPATDRYGDAHTSRFVRPLAGRSTLISIDEFVLVAQNVRAGAAVASVVGFRRSPRRTAGRGLGSLSRFGDGVDQSVVAALFANGSGVRGRPNVIASPGSLQRQPPAGTGKNPGAQLRVRRARARPLARGDKPALRSRGRAFEEVRLGAAGGQRHNASSDGTDGRRAGRAGRDATQRPGRSDRAGRREGGALTAMSSTET